MTAEQEAVQVIPTIAELRKQVGLSASVAASLFGPLPPTPNSKDSTMAVSDTSISALQRAKTEENRKRALRLIRESRSHGITDDEGGAAMGSDRRVFAPRRNGLVIEGLVKDSGRRRMNQNGNMVKIWVYVPPSARISAAPLNEAEANEAIFRSTHLKMNKADLVEVVVQLHQQLEATKTGTGDDAA